jgi:solute carrier family 35
LFAIPILAIAIQYRGDGYNGIYNYTSWYSFQFMVCMIISITMGFVLNFAILWNNQTNGPLSTTVMGSAKNVFTTYLGILGLGGDYIFTVINFMGLNVSMGGALLYSYVKFKSKKTGKNETVKKETVGNSV